MAALYALTIGLGEDEVALRTVYVLEIFKRKIGVPTSFGVQQFSSMEDAEIAARVAEARSAGSRVSRVEGDPVIGYWSDPEIISTFGRVS